MQLKFKEFLALGSFLGWFINYMKFKKVWAKWLFGLICLGSIVFIIFSRENEGVGDSQTATTNGSNSPAVNMSATTSGSNSPVFQNAPGGTQNPTLIYGAVTVTNNGEAFQASVSFSDQTSPILNKRKFYETRVIAHLRSPRPIGGLTVGAYRNSINSLDDVTLVGVQSVNGMPQPTSSANNIETYTTNGVSFPIICLTFANAFGDYLIKAESTNPEPFAFTYKLY